VLCRMAYECLAVPTFPCIEVSRLKPIQMSIDTHLVPQSTVFLLSSIAMLSECSFVVQFHDVIIELNAA
jgi:hypothetical protein